MGLKVAGSGIGIVMGRDVGIKEWNGRVIFYSV